MIAKHQGESAGQDEGWQSKGKEESRVSTHPPGYVIVLLESSKDRDCTVAPPHNAMIAPGKLWVQDPLLHCLARLIALTVGRGRHHCPSGHAAGNDDCPLTNPFVDGRRRPTILLLRSRSQRQGDGA
jgi:hypothetical protein